MTAAVGAIARRVKWEQRMYWRSSAAAGFTFAFPLMFLVVFAAIYGNDHVDVRGGTVRYAQYFVPSIVAFGVISACYSNLAITLTFRRQLGILKRVRGTPIAPATYIAGLIGHVIIVATGLCVLTMTLGVVAYDVTFPGRWLGLLVTVASAAFCFSAIGVAITTFIPNEDAAPAIVNFVLFPLLFISGTFGPVSSTSGLSKLAALFPVRHLVQQLVEVFNPFSAGTGIIASHIGVLLAWGAGALVVAVRRFRWEPQRS